MWFVVFVVFVVLPAPGKLEPDSPMLSMQESLAYVIKETVKLSTI